MAICHCPGLSSPKREAPGDKQFQRDMQFRNRKYYYFSGCNFGMIETEKNVDSRVEDGCYTSPHHSSLCWVV